MKGEIDALVNHYSAYFLGKITKEDLMEWVIYEVHNVWKSDLPLLLLDQEFDTSKFVNPESALNYRLLNLEAARNIQSNTAIANLAFSAAKAAVSGLNNLPVGLNLMLESLTAFLHTKNESAVMMSFRNVLRFYNQGVSAENISCLNEYYPGLLTAMCKMPGLIPGKDKLAEAANITLECLSAMHRFRYNSPLVQKTAAAFKEQVLPYLDNQDKLQIHMKLKAITN